MTSTATRVLPPHRSAAATGIDGGAGDDNLDAGSYDEPGDENVLTGGVGDDRLTTSLGTNTVTGGPGDDFFAGGDGRDVASGDAGEDDLFGSFGPDLLRGGDDDDQLEGGPDEDVVIGDAGNDGLAASFHGGCGGPDQFVGGSGRDGLYVFCGEPTLLLRDREADKATCKKKVKPVRIKADRKDKLTGPCER